MSNHSTEIWKNVAGYEGFYQASDFGRIKSLTRTIMTYRLGSMCERRISERILKPYIASSKHYAAVVLAKEGDHKIREIHRLILETFVGSCPEGMEACHNDGNRYNNCLENLRWDTRKNNHQDKVRHGTSLHGEKNPRFGKHDLAGENHPLAKLSLRQVEHIRKLRQEGEHTQRQLASMFGVSEAMISHIVNGKNWR